MPEVSVVMAVYNGERFLRESIESILEQTLSDLELILVDDGSIDGSRQIVERYTDPRISLIRNATNLGQAVSLNKGLRAATGRFVARQDADDVSERTRLERQVAAMNADPRLGLLGSWYRKIDVDGNILGHRRLPLEHVDLAWALLFYCPFVHSGIMWRRSVLGHRVDCYDERLRYAMDYDLWRRLVLADRVANLPEYLVRVRIHSGSMTATYVDGVREGDALALAGVARLLGWRLPIEPREAARYRAMAQLIGAWPTAGVAGEAVSAAINDLFRLHEAFCDQYQLLSAARRYRELRLREELGWRLLVLADSYLAEDRVAEAKHVIAHARRVHTRLTRRRRTALLWAKLEIAIRLPYGSGRRSLGRRSLASGPDARGREDGVME
jgi:hypothetical protein